MWLLLHDVDERAAEGLHAVLGAEAVQLHAAADAGEDELVQPIAVRALIAGGGEEVVPPLAEGAVTRGEDNLRADPARTGALGGELNVGALAGLLVDQ
ncbi:hypothetical protein V2I01_17810 [Micromonospora sp. BRA006-A]|nr:hypothetical protein [Micromonospora sp. BRA006-A]